MYKSKYISNNLTEEEEAPIVSCYFFFFPVTKNISLPELRLATEHQKT
jgi:hypothetical protein